MKWHSFRKRKLPVITPLVYYFTPYNKKTIGADFFYFQVIENKWNYEFILEKNFNDSADFLFKKLLKDKNYIKKCLLLSKKAGDKFMDFCKKNLSDNLKNKINRELISLLDEYRKFYEKFSIVNVPPWVFLGDKLADFLKQKLKSFSEKDSNDAFILLSTPNFLSYTKKEEIAILSSVIRIKEMKSDMAAESKYLSKKYFWIPFDYFGPKIWNAEYYTKKIRGLLGLRISTLNEEKKKVEESKNKLKIDQKNKIKKLGLSAQLVDLFEAIKGIAILQDDKKAITTECHYYLQNLYKEMARRAGLNFMDFYLLLNEEIKKAFLEKTNKKDFVEARRKFSVTTIKNGKVRIIDSEEALEFIKQNKVSLPSEKISNNIKIISGVSASSGKITGIVRVFTSSRYLDKMNKGEILVAAMTTPDYVPAMKKAAAIITDEGGVTCHAAIVSRELGIPCIIGTKIATKVLKDGDLVEVDANKGTVRIVK